MSNNRLYRFRNPNEDRRWVRAGIRYVSITFPYILELGAGTDTYSALMRDNGNSFFFDLRSFDSTQKRRLEYRVLSGTFSITSPSLSFSTYIYIALVILLLRI
jgi:hypothetical protein